MFQAEIISIGDEITSGRTLDTNSQWISRQLEDLGIQVLFHTTVGDELAANVAVFRQAIDRADVVIATGGLGPTADDLTRPALAEVSGTSLVLDQEELEHIRGLFARRGRAMPESNVSQAMFPAGSHPIHNPEGTAPGVTVEIARAGRSPCRIFALPGVPAELKQMWPTVEAALLSAGAGMQIRCHRQIKCFGAGESHVESLLPDLIRRGRIPRVGITASQATISLRITAEGANREECLAAMEPTVRTIHQCLGDLVFGEGDVELEDVVLGQLRVRGHTLSSIESTTGGLLAQWLGRAERKSPGVFRGGLVLPSQPLPPSTSKEELQAWLVEKAAVCRAQFSADVVLVVGPPPAAPADGAPPQLALAISGRAEPLEVKEVGYAAHSALLETLAAKQALNFLRLRLLASGSSSAHHLGTDEKAR